MSTGAVAQRRQYFFFSNPGNTRGSGDYALPYALCFYYCLLRFILCLIFIAALFTINRRLTHTSKVSRCACVCSFIQLFCMPQRISFVLGYGNAAKSSLLFCRFLYSNSFYFCKSYGNGMCVILPAPASAAAVTAPPASYMLSLSFCLAPSYLLLLVVWPFNCFCTFVKYLLNSF